MYAHISKKTIKIFRIDSKTKAMAKAFEQEQKHREFKARKKGKVAEADKTAESA